MPPARITDRFIERAIRRARLSQHVVAKHA